LSGFDRELRDWVVDNRVGVLDPLFEALSYAGSFGFIWIAIAVAISGFSWSRPWLWTRVGAAILIAESVSGALKELFERDRPAVADPDPETLVELPATFSFPSGHATVSFACATTLALAVPRLLSRSPVVHADAPASARAAWSPAELADLAARAGLAGAKVRRRFPQRMLLTWTRP